MSFHIEIGLTLFPSFMFVLHFKVARREREGEKKREREERQQAYFKRKGEWGECSLVLGPPANQIFQWKRSDSRSKLPGICPAVAICCAICWRLIAAVVAFSPVCCMPHATRAKAKGTHTHRQQLGHNKGMHKASQATRRDGAKYNARQQQRAAQRMHKAG